MLFSWRPSSDHDTLESSVVTPGGAATWKDAPVQLSNRSTAICRSLFEVGRCCGNHAVLVCVLSDARVVCAFVWLRNSMCVELLWCSVCRRTVHASMRTSSIDGSAA